MNSAMLISGGVDSSVALRLLQQQEHHVTAFYLKIWLEDELSFLGACPWQDDLEIVAAVCKQAGVPLEVINLQREYWDRVVTYTIDEIRRGRTPNPDMLCNQQVKFGAFCEVVDESFDFVATGHYAQITHGPTQSIMRRSPDAIKDQTYFLAYMRQKQLRRALFPIGHLEKAQVRQYAQEFDLVNQARKDSQGICFLGKLKFTEFVKYHLGVKEGVLVEYETGLVVGRHQGYWFYTLGQRQGLGLAGGPWYVVAKEVATNVVYISRQYYTDEKERNIFQIRECNWLFEEPRVETVYGIKLRHGPHIHTGHIVKNQDDLYTITLDQRDQAIAPGQFAVLYDSDICLGGGIIVRSF